MKNLVFAALATLAASNASASISYSRFSHPKGDYVMEYPSDWKRSVGMGTVWLRPPGKEGQEAQFGIQRYPGGKDTPGTPEAFVERLIAEAKGLKVLDSRQKVKVSGIESERLVFTLTAELKGAYGQKLPGPHKEVYLVVPAAKDFYYVLKLEGVGAAFSRQLPEFERWAGTVKFGPAVETAK